MKLRTKRILGALLIALGILGIVCELVLVLTYKKYLSRDWSQPMTRWNLLAFFTQITNIVVNTWLILVGIALLFNLKRKYKFLTKPHIQGALTLYIFVVGLIYCGILFWFTEPYSPEHWWGNFVNIWHHLIIPTGMVILWWRMPHQGHIRKRTLLYWMIYPIAYLIFSEIRGLVIRWYPYPFLDPSSGILFPLGLISLAIVITGFGYAFIWFHNAKVRKTHKKTPVEEMPSSSSK